VSLSDGWISEADAQALLDNKEPKPTVSTDLAHSTEPGSDGSASGSHEPKIAYEVMRLSAEEYLCSIPLVQQPNQDNDTDSELAKAEEARELSRATAHGWELLSGLGDQCLIFMSGWWTYKFCKNREIVQFHVPAAAAGQAVRDPHAVEYVLGAVPAIPTSSLQKARQNPDAKPLPAEVQVKGDQRYLVQKLEGGTICDLTGRERTIEVQYHCVPGLAQDRISWIKEVTICAYLMVVNTPRLCEDVAFLPPEEHRAHRIDCQLIMHENSIPPQIEQDSAPAKDTAQPQEQADTENVEGYEQKPSSEERPAVVGGIVVGARHVLSTGDEEGKPPISLKSPREQNRDSLSEKFIELIAQAASKAEGGKVQALTREEMEELDVDPAVVEEMRAEIEKIAGDAGWRLEVVDIPNDDIRELRGYIDGEDEEEEEEALDDKGSQEKFYRDEL
jgi:protein OS-9